MLCSRNYFVDRLIGTDIVLSSLAFGYYRLETRLVLDQGSAAGSSHQRAHVRLERQGYSVGQNILWDQSLVVPVIVQLYSCLKLRRIHEAYEFLGILVDPQIALVYSNQIAVAGTSDDVSCICQLVGRI